MVVCHNSKHCAENMEKKKKSENRDEFIVAASFPSLFVRASFSSKFFFAHLIYSLTPLAAPLLFSPFRQTKEVSSDVVCVRVYTITLKI